MNYNKIIKLNQRQFNIKMNKEGQTLLNHSKNVEEKVIFIRTNNNKNSQDKLTIFYNADGSIDKGDILYYRDNYYVVLNKNYPENDIWNSSSMVKCNTVWNLFGEIVPFVSGDLSSVNPSNGSIPTVGGILNFYTKDIPILHTKISINDYFYDFGGCYKLVNKFFIDGIAYFYFQRDVHNQNITYTFKCTNSSTKLNGRTKAKFYLSYEGSNGNYFLPTAKITYTSSDETVAIMKDDIIVPVGKGSVIITATCKYTFDYGDATTKNDTKTYKASVTFSTDGKDDEPVEPEPEEPDTPDDPIVPDNPIIPEPDDPDEPTDPDNPDNPDVPDEPYTPTGAETLEIESAKPQIRIGGTRKLNLTLYDKDGNKVTTNEIPSAKFAIIGRIEDPSSQITITDATTPSEFYFSLADNETTWAWAGYFMSVTLTYKDGVSDYINLSIVW